MLVTTFVVAAFHVSQIPSLRSDLSTRLEPIGIRGLSPLLAVLIPLHLRDAP